MKIICHLILVLFAGIAIFVSEAEAIGKGFSEQPDPYLSLAPGGTASRNFPAFQSDVSVTRRLTRELFHFIHSLTANAQMAPELLCHIRSLKTQGTRQFSVGTYWTEYLDLEMTTDHMGPRTLQFSFPMQSRFGRRITNMDGYGPVEEIKIESAEPYQAWFLFRHDGNRIVWAEMGNIYSFAPCLLK